MYYDTHFHLDLFPTPQKMVNIIEREKIYTLAVTNLPSLYKNTLGLVENTKYLKAALGYHPELIIKYPNEINSFKNLIKEAKYIGEVGLDYVQRTEEEKIIQRNVFENIIRLCNQEKNKVLTIHSRKAENDVIEIIGNNFPGKIILHWYSGDYKSLEKAINYGFYFSFNSSMINSKKGLNLIKEIPEDKLLTESDGPFVKRFGKSNSPIEIKYLISEYEKIKKVTKGHYKELFFLNFKKLLNE